jgi:hypothetical protein
MLVAMTTKQNSFSRSDINEELRLLLGAERGIQDAENLRPRLPLLSEHPAVVAQNLGGGRAFQRGLESVLGKAIELSDESAAMQKAVRWHLALDKDVVVEDAKARRERAAEIAPSKNMNHYWKDRSDEQRPDLTIALESVEAQLEVLGQASLGRPRVKIGGVEIPDILPLATCGKGQDATKDMTLEFEGALRDERPDCKEWSMLRGYLLPELGDEAKAGGRKFLNRPALDLVHAEEPDPDSDSPRRYRLGVAETDYNRWAATANSLDRDLSRHRELTELLGSNTLRQAWGHAPDCLEDLAELPAPCFMGVCVVVVAGSEIVVLARQRKHYVAGSEPSSAERSGKSTPVHFVGEGVEPKDFVPGYSPFERAAVRGCWEELKLEAKDIDLIPTAFVFDTLRWQPLFCYLAYCKLSVSDLEVLMQDADDDDETGKQIAALVPPTITAPKTRALLTGSDPSMRLASNHAETALLYALAYIDGLEWVASETR